MAVDPVSTKVTVASMAASAAGAAIVGLPFSILGVPAWGLLAGLVGAFCSYLPRHAVDTRDVPMRMLGVGSDAIIGGWLAVFLAHLTPLESFGIHAMPIEILCGLGGFTLHWLRKHFGPMVQQFVGEMIRAVAAMVAGRSRRSGRSFGDPFDLPPPDDSPPTGRDVE